MENALRKLFLSPLVALLVASFALVPVVEAARSGKLAASKPHAAAGGGARQKVNVDHSRADVRTNNVRSSSVNNVNVNKNVNRNVNRDVDVDVHHSGGWDNDYHPVATAVAVGATVAVTSAIVGSIVRSVPPGCVPVNYGGIIYQQCGNTWYQPRGTQFIVVNPPY